MASCVTTGLPVDDLAHMRWADLEILGHLSLSFPCGHSLTDSADIFSRQLGTAEFESALSNGDILPVVRETAESQVGNLNARGVVTGMEDIASSRDLPVVMLPDDPVATDHPRLPVLRNFDSGVSVLVQALRCFRAPRFADNDDTHKTVVRRTAFKVVSAFGRKRVPGLSPAFVVFLAPALRLNRLKAVLYPAVSYHAIKNSLSQRVTASLPATVVSVTPTSGLAGSVAAFDAALSVGGVHNR